MPQLRHWVFGGDRAMVCKGVDDETKRRSSCFYLSASTMVISRKAKVETYASSTMA